MRWATAGLYLAAAQHAPAASLLSPTTHLPTHPFSAVVYLDADTVVARNIDDLFLCDGLCGVMRHSERLNTGVLVLEVRCKSGAGWSCMWAHAAILRCAAGRVGWHSFACGLLGHFGGRPPPQPCSAACSLCARLLQPSAQLFADMMERVATTPSYTGGDQGFLNSFFSDFMEAPFFDPGRGLCLSAAQPQWTSRTGIRVGAGGGGRGLVCVKSRSVGPKVGLAV